jgi:hypothetical protein
MTQTDLFMYVLQVKLVLPKRNINMVKMQKRSHEALAQRETNQQYRLKGAIHDASFLM